MRNAIIYLGIIGFSIYASYLAGNILAKIDDSNSNNITEQVGVKSHSNGQSNSPFDFLIPQTHNYSLGESELSRPPSGDITFTNPNSGSSGGSAFTIFEERKSTQYIGSSGESMSTTIVRSSGKNKNLHNDDSQSSGRFNTNFGGSTGKPGKAFDGAISMRTEQSQNKNARIDNSTGSFSSGNDFGDEEFSTLSPIPTPTPIPLDSGSIILIILGVLAGSYFILKNQAILNASKES